MFILPPNQQHQTTEGSWIARKYRSLLLCW